MKTFPSLGAISPVFIKARRPIRWDGRAGAADAPTKSKDAGRPVWWVLGQQSLCLSHNQFTAVPPECIELTKLEVLDMRSVPACGPSQRMMTLIQGGCRRLLTAPQPQRN